MAGVTGAEVLRVGVLDALPLMGDAIEAAVSESGVVEVAMVASRVGEFAAVVGDVDVVVVGVSCDDSGVALLREAAKLNVPLVVCLHEVRDYLISAALSCRIHCVVSMSDSAAMLHRGLTLAANAEWFMGQSIEGRFKSGQGARALLRSSDVTRDHRRLMVGVCRGWTSKQLAEEIGVAPSTVEYRKRRLVRDLGLQKSIDLVRYAHREGLIDDD